MKTRIDTNTSNQFPLTNHDQLIPFCVS